MYPVNQSIAHSDDVHHQATLLRAWDQEYTQLRAGDFTGSVGTLATPGIKLFSEQMNRAVFQTGALPEGRLAFGLPLRASGRCRICGEDGTADDVLVFSGRSGFEFVSPDLFTFVGIEIDPASSEDPVFVGMVALLERVISSDRRSIRIDPAKAAKLGRLLTAMLSDDGPGARLEEWPDQAAAFNRGLVGWLLDMLQPSEPDGGPVTPRHWQAISAIRQTGEDQPLLPDLGRGADGRTGSVAPHLAECLPGDRGHEPGAISARFAVERSAPDDAAGDFGDRGGDAVRLLAPGLFFARLPDDVRRASVGDAAAVACAHRRMRSETLAPVDHKGHTRHEARGVRSQVDNRLGDLVHRAEATHRDGFRDIGLQPCRARPSGVRSLR